LLALALTYAMFGSTCLSLENHNALQVESIIDPNLAYDPHPPDGSIHHDLWVALSWSAGRHVASHDVYWGDNFEDVNNGTWNTFKGNQLYTFFVIGFPSFAYPDILVPGTTYYWRIDEVNDLLPDSPWKGNIWSLTIGPKEAYNPNPPGGAEYIDPNVTLSWTAGIDALAHTVYFGDNFDDVNTVTEGPYQLNTTYTPGPLEFDKTYYWRVDEYDGFATYKGNVWSFRTKPYDPNLAHYPKPPDGAIHEDLWALLSWSPGRHATSHNVYWGDNFYDVNNGTANTFWGNQLPTYFFVIPGYWYDLIPGTTYYWRIDEVNDLHPDSPWKGNVWSFTIPQYTAYNPDPTDDARFIDPNVMLSWDGGFRAKVHHVYFGESYSDVNDGLGRAYKGPVDSTTYNPGPLELGKSYYWRIDEFDGNNTYKGDVWRFRTKSSLFITDPNLAYDPWPSDGAIHEVTWAVISWLPGCYASSHDVYFGDNFDNVNNGTGNTFYYNQLSTWFIVGFPDYAGSPGLIPGTTYYWRIDEVNNLHPDSPWKGDVWSFNIRPRTAFNPNPSDGAKFIDTNVTLSWSAGLGAKSHTVYFGDNFDDVNDGTGGTYKGLIEATTYIPSLLELNKTYYWRVDEFDGVFTHKGSIWSFTTGN
jgi:hypothetical protein